MEGKRISQLTPDTSPSTDDFIVSVDGTTMQNKRVDFGSLPVSNPTVALFDTKVDKAPGKQLSDQNYTQDEKNKLAGVEAGAEVNTVDSVAGKTGAVTLAKGDVGLANVDNTSDADKPVSTAQQTALNAKADFPTANLSVPVRGGAGVQTSIPYSPTATGGSIVLRSGTGTISTATPTADPHATTKSYVDAADSLKVNKAGDIMTGHLTSIGAYISTSGSSLPFQHNRAGAAHLSTGVAGDGAYVIWDHDNTGAIFRAFSNGISLGGASTPDIIHGTGFPNGVVSARVGSTYIDTNATNGITHWYKLSGSGNTGYVPQNLSSTVPASASAVGIAGQQAYDANYHYICVATNTWKRVAIASW